MQKRGRKPKADKNQIENSASIPIDLDQDVTMKPLEEKKEQQVVFKAPKEFNHTKSYPKSTVVKIITEKLRAKTGGAEDSGLKLAQQSQDLILDLAMSFLDHVADAANDICQENDRATITPDHIIDAMLKMNLTDYLKQMEEPVQVEPETGGRRSKKKQPPAPIDPQEQRIRIMNRLNNQVPGAKFGKKAGSCCDSDDIDQTPEQLAMQQRAFLDEARNQLARNNSIEASTPAFGIKQQSIQQEGSYYTQNVNNNEFPIQNQTNHFPGLNQDVEVAVNNLPGEIEMQPQYEDPSMMFSGMIEDTDFSQQPDQMQQEAPSFWQQFDGDAVGEENHEIPLDEQMIADLNLMQFARLDLNQVSPEASNQMVSTPTTQPKQPGLLVQGGSSVGSPTSKASGIKQQPGTNKVKRKKSK